MINKVIDILKETGKVVALRTDTVYGLVANADDEIAVNKIYELKNRDYNKPLSLFIKDNVFLYNILENKFDFNLIENITKDFWPGALTIIVKKKKGIYDYITSNKDTIAVRIPNDKLILNLLNSIPFPLAQTSCNISNELPYEDATKIKEVFGNKIDMIIDSGKIKNGVPSTIIEVIDGKIKIIREGSININEKRYKS